MITTADIKRALAVVTEREVATLEESTRLDQLGIDSFGISELILEIECLAGGPLRGTPADKMRRLAGVRTIADLTGVVNEMLAG